MATDTGLGRSPSGRAAAADAVEPVSAVSSKADIPNAAPQFVAGRWYHHSSPFAPDGIDEAVDAVGTDGGMVEGFWPHNVVWKNVVRWKLHDHSDDVAPNALSDARIRELEAEVSLLREKLSDALAAGGGHWSDCAVYSAPAEEPGPCDCDRQAPRAAQ